MGQVVSISLLCRLRSSGAVSGDVEYTPTRAFVFQNSIQPRQNGGWRKNVAVKLSLSRHLALHRSHFSSIVQKVRLKENYPEEPFRVKCMTLTLDASPKLKKKKPVAALYVELVVIERNI